MSWTNLDWSRDRTRGIAFFCNCCNYHNYRDGVFMEGKDGYGKLKAILCLDCFKYIGGECEHCNPPDEERYEYTLHVYSDDTMFDKKTHANDFQDIQELLFEIVVEHPYEFYKGSNVKVECNNVIKDIKFALKVIDPDEREEVTTDMFLTHDNDIREVDEHYKTLTLHLVKSNIILEFKFDYSEV